MINSVDEFVSTIAAAEEQSVTTKEIPNNVHEAADGIMEVNENVAQVIDFQKQYEKGEKGISRELMGFLKDWNVDHIKKTDMQFSQFLSSRGGLSNPAGKD